MTMKCTKVMLGSLALAVASFAAQAADDDMSYSNLDLGYVETDIDGAPSADGFGLRGSVGFAQNWFAFGEYVNQDLAGVDIDQFAVGLGGHYGLTEEMDLTGRVGYVDAEASVGGVSASVDGYLLSLGLRGQIGDAFELEGRVDHTDLGNQGGDDQSLAIAGRYFFTNQFAVGAELATSDDANSYLVGVRWNF
jgi:hypothetical protein